jgi:cell division septum initiation protein DivIVA
MKSKSEEIQILTAAADSLGSDSYCGAWLREQIPFIESDIQSDIEPGILASASIQDCARRCAEMRVKAIEERDKILSDARDEAERIMDAALKLADSIRSGLRRDIESALHQITKI